MLPPVDDPYLSPAPTKWGRGVLELHVPSRAEFPVRRAWLADPDFMSYNADWDVDHPGHDLSTTP